MVICTATIKTGHRKGTKCGIIKCGIHNKKPAKLTHVYPLRLKFKRCRGCSECPNCGKEYLVKELSENLYPNQKIAANGIMNYYKQGKHFVVLVAQCQCGKTGVAKHLIGQFSTFTNGDFIPILMIPISDNDILNQAQREFHDLIQPAHILSLPQMLDTTILLRLKNDYPNMNFLIIIDESDQGATLETDKDTNSILTLLQSIYINPNGLSCPNDCYILSISATANAEVSGLIDDNVSRNKGKIVLQPGSDYYGIEQMFQDQKVYQSFDLTLEEQQIKLAQLIAHKYNSPGHAIIRVNSKKHSEDLAKLIRPYVPNCRINHYDSDHTKSDKLPNIIKNKPQQLTITLLIGRCRASMQIDTRYVLMVHEHCRASTPTTTQGLPGRCCGFCKRAHKVDIYCNLEALQLQLNWIKSNFSSKSVPICKSITGGVSGRETTTDHWEACKPVCGLMTTSLINDLQTELWTTGTNKLSNTFYQKNIINQIKTSILTPDTGYIPIKGNGMTIIKSNTTTLKTFWTSKTNHIKNQKPHHGFDTSHLKPDQKGYYIYINMIPGTDYGKYRIYFTHYNDSQIREKFSQPKENSIFHKKHTRKPKLKVNLKNIATIKQRIIVTIKNKIQKSSKIKVSLKTNSNMQPMVPVMEYDEVDD